VTASSLKFSAEKEEGVPDPVSWRRGHWVVDVASMARSQRACVTFSGVGSGGESPENSTSKSISMLTKLAIIRGKIN